MGDNNLKYFELNTGAKIPSIGLGTYATPPHIIVAAIKSGYRHIDCAHAYQNEKQIGQVLKQLFDEGVVKREELFITSKHWNDDHEPEDVPKALDRTLADLQLDYLDLYLIHWPVKEKKDSVSNEFEKYVAADIPGTWKAMEELYDSGKVRAIGVSNFSTKKLQDLLEVARVPPAVNQVESHPMWQQTKLHDFCKSKGIHLSETANLGKGGTGMVVEGDERRCVDDNWFGRSKGWCRREAQNSNINKQVQPKIVRRNSAYEIAKSSQKDKG